MCVSGAPTSHPQKHIGPGWSPSLSGLAPLLTPAEHPPPPASPILQAGAEGSGAGAGRGGRVGTESSPRTFSGWPGQGPFLSMRSYLGQRACKAGRPQRPHKAHSAQPLFTHLLSPRAHTTATPAQRLSPSFDVQEQKTAIKCCFKEGVLTALPSVKRKLRPEGEGCGGGAGGLGDIREGTQRRKGCTERNRGSDSKANQIYFWQRIVFQEEQ